MNIHAVSQPADQAGQNVVTGNRHNLLFVQTALEHIRQCQERAAPTDQQRAAQRLESSILGLQVGHYESVRQAVASMQMDTNKGHMWAAFRSASTQIRLYS